MKKKPIVTGIALIIAGVVFVSVSRIYGWAYRFESVTGSCGHFFSSHIQVNLEGNEKYRLLWSGTLTGYESEYPTLEVKDPDGNTLYSTYLDPSELPHTIDFWGDLSGVYTIDFNVLKSEDAIYNVYKYVETTETTYSYYILLPVGLSLVVSGVVVTIVGAARRSKELKT